MTKKDARRSWTHSSTSTYRECRDKWLIRVTNKEVRKRARTCTISEQIRRRRWCWIGHVLRIDHQQNPHIALTWEPVGAEASQGRHGGNCRGREGDRQKMVFASWNEATATARDIADWRRLINSLTLPEERQDKMMMMKRYRFLHNTIYCLVFLALYPKS